jgi:hypothetical protein
VPHGGRRRYSTARLPPLWVTAVGPCCRPHGVRCIVLQFFSDHIFFEKRGKKVKKKKITNTTRLVGRAHFTLWGRRRPRRQSSLSVVVVHRPWRLGLNPNEARRRSRLVSSSPTLVGRRLFLLPASHPFPLFGLILEAAAGWR